MDDRIAMDRRRIAAEQLRQWLWDQRLTLEVLAVLRDAQSSRVVNSIMESADVHRPVASWSSWRAMAAHDGMIADKLIADIIDPKLMALADCALDLRRRPITWIVDNAK